MKITDFAYNLMTGQHKLDRLRVQSAMRFAEREQYYAGARITQDRPTPAQLHSPEDFLPSYQRIVLIRAARQMEEDQPFFDGILGDFENYVVGDLKYRSATGNADADKVINEYLEWQFSMADFTRRLDLCDIARLTVRSGKRDGEMGAVFVDDGEGVRLQYINGDRIGNPMIGTAIGPTNFNGIITDPNTGIPLLFQIYQRVPKLNTYVFQADVKANDFRHYYDPFRFDQYHGVTAFKNAVEHALDMKQIMDFSKLNIKWRASQLPYVTNEAGKPRGNGYRAVAPTTDGQPRPFDVNVGGVTQSFLKLGEGVMEYPNDFPNQQFRPMMDEIKRECCLGVKLPFEFVFRSDAGGVIQRFYVNKAETTFANEKRRLKRVLLDPYKNRCIQKGIDTGFLDLSKFGTLSQDQARFRGVWQMGKMVSVDYKNEVTADIAQIDQGLMSEDEYASEQGRDLEVIRQQKKDHTRAVLQDAKELSEELNLPLETVLPYLQKKFPNPDTSSPQSKKDEEMVAVE
ncbi:MAG: phage portal protein [Proteobacteria bacterium]|nr:phage portal protein [Pseudomonadota bacterium]